MDLAQIIQKYGSLYEIRARDKISFFAEISQKLATNAGETTDIEIETVLRERESIESTALGPGVALPHGKCPGIQKPICCFAVSRDGVDFGAADGSLTHIFFVMLTPASNNGSHLATLAEVSMIMSDPGLRQSIMEAETKQDVIDTMQTGETNHPETEKFTMDTKGYE